MNYQWLFHFSLYDSQRKRNRKLISQRYTLEYNRIYKSNIYLLLIKLLNNLYGHILDMLKKNHLLSTYIIIEIVRSFVYSTMVSILRFIDKFTSFWNLFYFKFIIMKFVILHNIITNKSHDFIKYHLLNQSKINISHLIWAASNYWSFFKITHNHLTLHQLSDTWTRFDHVSTVLSDIFFSLLL